MKRFLRLLAVAVAAGAVVAVPAAAARSGAPMSTQYTLTVVERGAGYGSVTSSPAGIDCSWGGCSAAFPAGTQVTLTITPHPQGFVLGYSIGCQTRSAGTCGVTMDGNRKVILDFSYSSSPPPPPPPQFCVVPRVKGKTLATAKQAITRNHCRVGKITKIKSSPKNTGHVISQSPRAGTHLKKGAKVALRLGK